MSVNPAHFPVLDSTLKQNECSIINEKPSRRWDQSIGILVWFVKEGGIHLNCVSIVFPRMGPIRSNTAVRSIKHDKYPENTVWAFNMRSYKKHNLERGN